MERRDNPAGGAGLTRAPRALTTRALAALKPETAPFRIPDSRCKGLAVRVASGGTVTFDLAFRIKGGTSRRVSLGAFPDRSLEEARSRANELTAAARLGRDLIAEEKRATERAGQRTTVAGLIERYMKRPEAARLKTKGEITRRLHRALEPIKGRPADDIRRRDLRELFNATFEAGTPREAEQRRINVGAMFRWGIEQDIVETDPTAGIRSFGTGDPRERVLTHDEIRTVWAYLEHGDMPEAHATVLKLELLLGARCGEVAGMHAREFDQETWLWTLPGERSKNRKPRVTPIVGLAREIVAGNCDPAWNFDPLGWGIGVQF